MLHSLKNGPVTVSLAESKSTLRTNPVMSVFTEFPNCPTSLLYASKMTDRAASSLHPKEWEKAAGHGARQGDQTQDTEETGPRNPETRKRSDYFSGTL